MDIKITKKRLNDHLSYDWVKYLGLILAAILFWSLILTMAKPRMPNSKEFNMFIIAPGVNSAKMQELEDRLRADIDSEAVLEVNVTFWNSTDTQTTPQLVQTRKSTAEFDAAVWDNMQPGKDTEKPEEITSNFKGSVDEGSMDSLTDLLAEIAALEADMQEYAARMKKEKKFNKIDTQADIDAGFEREQQRIARLKDEAHKLSCYLGLETDERYSAIPNLAFRYVKGTQAGRVAEGEPEKIWGINLAKVPDTSGVVLKGINSLLSYDTENDKLPQEYALGLMFKQANLPYHYEYVKVVNAVIELYK